MTLRCSPVPRILSLIGADFAMADDFVRALADELSPVVEGHRKIAHSRAQVEAPSNTSLQAKLPAMAGRN